MITLKNITLIICSLFVFLYTLNYLRSLLENKTSENFKNIILKYTSNYHISFILGIFLTLVLSSSSCLTAITLAFLGADLIKEKSALGIILGANIGTAFTSIFFSFNITNYAFLFILVGITFYIFKTKFLACFFLSTGVLLFSLLVLHISLKDSSKAISGFISISPIVCFLEGIIFSIIVNSSSSIIITSSILYNLNAIYLYQALLLMLGANIGTTITSLLMLFSLNKKTLKIILINIIYNLLGGIFFLVFIDYFEMFILLFNTIPKNLLIPFAHLLYNIITTLIVYIYFSFYKPKTT